jgi:hypothetical protein
MVISAKGHEQFKVLLRTSPKRSQTDTLGIFDST